MQRTALYNSHLKLGGRMVNFAGWELPVQYPTGPTKEHVAVRTAAGLFDIDHMGQFELSGSGADAFLQYIQVADVNSLDTMDARYSLLPYADGTIVDDIFLYRLPDRWLIVVNAANRSKDFAWMNAHIHRFDAILTDISDETYMLALQGPAAQTILQQHVDTDLSRLAIRKAVESSCAGIRTLVGRTGYTGEDGFELYFPADMAVSMWETLLSSGGIYGLLPCGLGARDSLRFEACMPLYGHEIDATTSPIEARLGWAVDLDHEFIGRSPILKATLEKPVRRLVGLEMIDRSVARDGYEISVDSKRTGYVTSGMRSPTLGKFLAMGYVNAEHSRIGHEVDIHVRGAHKRARIVKRPFYRRSSD